MAVSSFLKSSGLAALAAALTVVLPVTASAQDGGRPMWRQQQAQTTTQAEAQPRRQRDGGGEGGRTWRREAPQAQAQTGAPAAQGGGQVQAQPRWQGQREGGRTWRRDAPQTQAPAQVQAPARVQSPAQVQAQPRWQGQRDGTRTWRQDNPTAGTRQTAQRSMWGAPSGGDTRVRDGARARDGDRRWDNDRNRVRDNNTRWSGNDRSTRQWNNNWRRDNRYNWSSYRNNNRNVFRMDRYYSPYRNWNYRRLSIGFSLQPLFYSSSYWINDPWQYRLPEAYGPYRWVRYYDDALLVDIYSGEVVDVINDFFW